jgi:hypothetical protein
MQYPVMEWRSIGSLAQVESKGTFGSRAGLVARPAGCIRLRSEAWTAYWGWVSGCKRGSWACTRDALSSSLALPPVFLHAQTRGRRHRFLSRVNHS